MTPIDETSEQLKANVLTRLRKVGGQIRGIERMVVDGKECAEILVQVKAVKSALQSMSKVILKRYLVTCYDDLEGADETSAEERLAKTIDVLTNFVE